MIATITRTVPLFLNTLDRTKQKCIIGITCCVDVAMNGKDMSMMIKREEIINEQRIHGFYH